MKILGIETSCDETAASVVFDGCEILSNAVVSQIDIFKEYGGVIPEVAARSHLEVMMPVIDKALSDAKCNWDDIDAIAVTHAPGLLGSLLIGTLTARTLAILHNKPLYAVHHLKSHVYTNWLNMTESKNPPLRNVPSGPSSRASVTSRSPRRRTCSSEENFLDSSAQAPKFPLLALVVSGGHTQILYMQGHNQFEIVGTTHDDAVGECFDKVAKILGLPYPGGPSIASAAKGESGSILLRHTQGRSTKPTVLEGQHQIRPGDPNRYKLPHPKVAGLDFSFSGLKTAVLRAVQKEVGVPISYPSHQLKKLLTEQQVADFAASFQKTAVEILCEKIEMALSEYPEAQSVVVAGGVSANEELRKIFMSRLRERGIEVFFPVISLSGDNGAMVAGAAYYEIQSGVEPTNPYTLNIYPRISIEN